MRYVLAFRALVLAPVVFGLVACSNAKPLQTVSNAGRLNCISTLQIAGRRVSGTSAVLFEMIGPSNYVNDMGNSCPQIARLGKSAVISIASGGEGGQLCRGDRIRVFDPVEARGSQTTYPTCVLNDFTAVAGN